MVTDEERQFLSYVKAHRNIGYGRMRQIIANEWYRMLEREHPGLEGGAFAGDRPFVFLPEREQRGFLTILADEEKQGMDY